MFWNFDKQKDLVIAEYKARTFACMFSYTSSIRLMLSFTIVIRSEFLNSKTILSLNQNFHMQYLKLWCYSIKNPKTWSTEDILNKTQ